jgi:hypothetical protein
VGDGVEVGVGVGVGVGSGDEGPPSVVPPDPVPPMNLSKVDANLLTVELISSPNQANPPRPTTATTTRSRTYSTAEAPQSTTDHRRNRGGRVPALRRVTRIPSHDHST